MGKKIGITYDLRTDWKLTDEDCIDTNAEFDKPETLEFIVKAIEAGGHKVERIGNAKELLKKVNDLDVDMVFNVCEGYCGRNRESEVPVILEMHGIPFMGSDALTMGLTLDKLMAKKQFVAEGLPTPRYFGARDSKNLKDLNDIGYPLMVKPCYEGTSKGITEKSRVNNFEELKTQVDLINNQYHQPAVVEEFIRGSEFTVAVVGNENPQALNIAQVRIGDLLELGDEFFTFDRVADDAELDYLCPAQISDELKNQMQSLAIRAYESVDCRDFGRVDFRVDEQGHPYVLEINPLPSLAHNDVFNQIPQTMGRTYAELVNHIIDVGLHRNGLISDSLQPFALNKEALH